MSNEIAIPFAGQKPSAAFASLSQSQDSLADGIVAGYGVLTYKGKVWTLRYRGERHTFVRPDDGSPSGYIDVVILQAASHLSKSYYPSYKADSDGTRPLCASLDGVHPDMDIQEKQAPACALCPRNMWTTNQEGRKAKDCQDYKRLAVLLLPSQSKALLGDALLEPVFLRIPPASLTGLATYGTEMQRQGYHFSQAVTRISFDPNQPHPKMVFRPIQLLTDAEAPVVLPLREDPVTMRIIGGGQATAAPVQVHQIPASDRVETGFPTAPKQEVLPPKKTVAKAVPAVEDVGEATASDSALDERIKNLLNTA